MTVPSQQYKPIGSLAVEMAVASVLSAGVVTAVEVTLRSKTAIATPTSFITDNDLVNEVVSRAGLDEATTFTGYVLASSSTPGDDFVYVVTAAVT
ncbi:hypothetical protein LCGC14_0645900 [marine sediment metagenome]|uniref:Uncharacterized protein n=1 Tax=marine sediment metagenome TaxID=412755 RepID=A0A0F9RHD2_9ZZZZ